MGRNKGANRNPLCKCSSQSTLRLFWALLVSRHLSVECRAHSRHSVQGAVGDIERDHILSLKPEVEMASKFSTC